jgi:hypothetical protein
VTKCELLRSLFGDISAREPIKNPRSRIYAARNRTGGAATLALAFLVASQSSLPLYGAPNRLPQRLEEYLATVVRPTPAERNSLIAGQPITKLLEADPGSEVAVFGAVWINAPIRRYVEAIRDIENLERGRGFRATKRISARPQIKDFSDMHITADDVEDIRTCRVGDCRVKLSEEALRRFKAGVDWRSPNRQDAADTVMRQLALEYVNGYLEGGDERLAVYRDRARPTFVAQEFRSMVDRMPLLSTSMPMLRRYLLDYPNVQLPQATSFLYWQDVQFGLKPTLRISHLTIWQGPDDTIVASKMLYASHYFWAALELRALVPDPSRGPGFWLFTISRSRSDGLSGFLGRFIRSRVWAEAQKGVLATLRATRSKLEH